MKARRDRSTDDGGRGNASYLEKILTVAKVQVRQEMKWHRLTRPAQQEVYRGRAHARRRSTSIPFAGEIAERDRKINAFSPR